MPKDRRIKKLATKKTSRSNRDFPSVTLMPNNPKEKVLATGIDADDRVTGIRKMKLITS